MVKEWLEDIGRIKNAWFGGCWINKDRLVKGSWEYSLHP